MSQLIKIMIFTLSTTCLLLSLFHIPHAIAKRFVSDMPKEAQDKIIELENAVGIDTQIGMFTKSYSDNMVDTLLGALQSQYKDVKYRSLTLLAEVIKNFDIPNATLKQKVKPAVTLLIEGNLNSDDKADIQVVQLVKQVIWQIDYKNISGIKERLEFLKSNVENTSDGSLYYSFESIDYLTGIGSDDAKSALVDKLKESAKRSMSKDIIDKLTVSIEKIELIQEMEKLNSPKRAKKISELISEYKEEKDSYKKGLLIWLIRQLETIDDPLAIQILKDIIQDEGFNIEYRYNAQEILIRLKGMKPEERIIHVDY